MYSSDIGKSDDDDDNDDDDDDLVTGLPFIYVAFLERSTYIIPHTNRIFTIH